MPRVSVIITTHNRPGLLPRAVGSAHGACEDVEVIVVDDASTDETAEVCRALPGVRYVRAERNQGVAGARALGLLASTAEYVTFLDDDDVRLPGTLDEQAEVLDSTPDAGLVYGQAHIGDRDCAPTGSFYPEQCLRGDVFWQLLEQNFVPCGSVLFRKSCVRRIGLPDKNVAGVDDWDLWVRIAELYPVAAVERPVIIWRQSTADSGQGSSRSAELMAPPRSRFAKAGCACLARGARRPGGVAGRGAGSPTTSPSTSCGRRPFRSSGATGGWRAKASRSRCACTLRASRGRRGSGRASRRCGCWRRRCPPGAACPGPRRVSRARVPTRADGGRPRVEG